jgi:hypothetical protein
MCVWPRIKRFKITGTGVSSRIDGGVLALGKLGCVSGRASSPSRSPVLESHPALTAGSWPSANWDVCLAALFAGSFCCPTSSPVVRRPRDTTSEETKCAKELSSMLFGAFEIGRLVLDYSLLTH